MILTEDKIINRCDIGGIAIWYRCLLMCRPSWPKRKFDTKIVPINHAS